MGMLSESSLLTSHCQALYLPYCIGLLLITGILQTSSARQNGDEQADRDANMAKMEVIEAY
jgi:hypothetical protein